VPRKDISSGSVGNRHLALAQRRDEKYILSGFGATVFHRCSQRSRIRRPLIRSAAPRANLDPSWASMPL